MGSLQRTKRDPKILGKSLSAWFEGQRENWCLPSPPCLSLQQPSSAEKGSWRAPMVAANSVRARTCGGTPPFSRQETTGAGKAMCLGWGDSAASSPRLAADGELERGRPHSVRQQRAGTYGTRLQAAQNCYLKSLWGEEKKQTRKREAKKEKPLPKPRPRRQRGKNHAAKEHAWPARADFTSGRNHSLARPSPLHPRRQAHKEAAAIWGTDRYGMQ